MEKENNTNSNSLFLSLPFALSVQNPPSGWCFTDGIVSHVETDLIFLPEKHKLSSSAKLKKKSRKIKKKISQN